MCVPRPYLLLLLCRWALASSSCGGGVQVLDELGGAQLGVHGLLLIGLGHHGQLVAVTGVGLAHQAAVVAAQHQARRAQRDLAVEAQEQLQRVHVRQQYAQHVRAVCSFVVQPLDDEAADLLLELVTQLLQCCVDLCSAEGGRHACNVASKLHVGHALAAATQQPCSGLQRVHLSF
jgi:hypothetical protein